MKIGIVTYHRTLNYGAVMQALATRFVLEEMGHEAYYVDYWPDYHKEMYALFPKHKFFKFSLRKKIAFLLSFIKNYNSKKRRIDNFEKFFQTHIYPYCRPIDNTYDVVVYGSDQIWRKQPVLGTYNPFYFGVNEIKTKHHISYAASMGNLPDNDADKAIIKNLVIHLDRISVRENNLKQFLLSLGVKNVSLSLDPTLLLNSEMWNKYLPTKKYIGEKYALLYFLRSNPFDMNEIKKFTKGIGLKLIVLRGYADTKETNTNITTSSPYEFVRLIKNADYVFSASFHGLAFSIIYGKQVFASFNTNASRAESLLTPLGMSDRLIDPMSSIPKNAQSIDYEDVRNRITKLRECSLNYFTRI